MAANRLKKEFRARILLLFLVLGLPLGVMAWGWKSTPPAIKIVAAMPERGGWKPGTLQAIAGKPLTLQLTSEDVVHGFAIGQSEQPQVDILPGKFNEITLTFDEPGRYTYYCTRWCGPNHWRMRGTIIVSGDQIGPTQSPSTPLYVVMGFDLDGIRRTENTPTNPLSIRSGQELLVNIDDSVINKYQESTYLRTHSPSDVWSALREESFAQDLSKSEIWDLVAALWQPGITSEDNATGEQLYTQNCAACHGTYGDGNGVFASSLDLGEQEGSSPLSDTISPADFTDAERMLATSSAVLQGKMIRGGMGTGMPYFGPIFTEEQSWSLVNYLWTFQFSD
jgi:mono/diheme cytochrome c family protein/plastocyanin